MAAQRGLVGAAGAHSFACLAALSMVVTSARAEPLAPLPRSAAAPAPSVDLFALTVPFSSNKPPPVVLDLGRAIRPLAGWSLRLVVQLDYFDLPISPARGRPGMFAFVGTSMQSLGGFRLHF